MRFKIALFKDGVYVQGSRVFYIIKQGNYEMFHAWSLGKPAQWKCYLAFLFRSPFGLFGYRDSFCCSLVLKSITLNLKEGVEKSNQI